VVPMNYVELYAAVKGRLDVVADQELRERDSAAHLEALKAAAARLDALVADLPSDADSMLRHYLEKQSYVKARDWLASHLAPGDFTPGG
jgi:hypothetical protein